MIPHTNILPLILSLLLCLFSLNGAKAQATRTVTNLEHFERISIAKRINALIMMQDEWEKQVAARSIKTHGAQHVKVNGPMVVIKAEPTVAGAVVCHVEDGRLYIYANPYKYKRSQRIDVTIVVDSTLTEIHGESGSNISTKGCLRVKNLLLQADYAIEMHVTAKADYINVDAQNKSIIWVTGTVGLLNANINDASFLRMKQIKCQNTTVNVRDESKAEVTALQYLSIYAEGASQVSYYAPGASVTSNAMSGSTISQIKNLDNL